MGCAHTKTASLHQTLDVLITQSHALNDPAAVELATWMQTTCAQRGLVTFYHKGLCGSVKLEGTRRRQLRNAFESARCVAAAAVMNASETAPLANEILWAEQHNKPVLLVYDSSKALDLHLWQSTWPPLFQPVPMVSRYYGKGHEVCADGFISQVKQLISGPQPAPAKPSEKAPEIDRTRDILHISNETWEKTLNQLRAAQPNDLPEVQSKGILRRRVRKAPTQGAPDHFYPQEALHEAICYAVKALPRLDGSDELLDLLCASVGVSERLVAASLRHLVARIETEEGDFLEELQVWCMIALKRHGDSVDVCTFAMQCLDLSAASQKSFSSADAECLVGAIRNGPSCQALQRHGFSFLAQLLAHQMDAPSPQSDGPMLALPGGGLARILTRLGVAELALSAVLLYDEPLLFQDVCFLLQKLAPSSREVKLSVLGKGRKLWVRELRRLDGSAPEALSMLSSLIADDDESKVAAGAATDLLEALQWRVGVDQDVLEVYAFLCCLTSHCLENKRRLSAFDSSVFVREAVKICKSELPTASLRVAAGGFLVNLCSDSANIATVSSLGCLDAASALSGASGELARCGEALRHLMESSKYASDGSRWKAGADAPEAENPFSGLFAIRQMKQAQVEAPPVKRLPLKMPQEDVPRPKPERARDPRTRGPGWLTTVTLDIYGQRLPSHARGAGRDVPAAEVTPEPDFELGDWASSELARPLSGFQGLSKDLWMKRDGLEKASADCDDAATESVGIPSPRSLLEPKAAPVLDVGRPVAAQVSKGRTLRPHLKDLRSKATAPEAPRRGFFQWFRRAPEAQETVDQRAHLWMAQRAEVRQGEIDLDFPSQKSVGQARGGRTVDRQGESGLLGQGSRVCKPAGPLPT